MDYIIEKFIFVGSFKNLLVREGQIGVFKFFGDKKCIKGSNIVLQVNVFCMVDIDQEGGIFVEKSKGMFQVVVVECFIVEFGLVQCIEFFLKNCRYILFF